MAELFRSYEFWVALGFVAFIGLIAKRGYQRVTKILDNRAAAIKAELEQAAALREEAQMLLANYERKQREAAEETENILAHAREEAQRKRALAKEELEAFVKRQRELAQQAIAQAEARAVREVRDAAIDAALAATVKLIRENLDEKRAEALIDRTVADLSKQLH